MPRIPNTDTRISSKIVLISSQHYICIENFYFGLCVFQSELFCKASFSFLVAGSLRSRNPRNQNCINVSEFDSKFLKLNGRLQLPLGINGERGRFVSTPNGLTSSINQSSKKQQSKWRSINCQVCGILDEKINEEGFSNLLRTMLNILVLVGTRYNDNFSPVEFTFEKLAF